MQFTKLTVMGSDLHIETTLAAVQREGGRKQEWRGAASQETGEKWERLGKIKTNNPFQVGAGLLQTGGE